MTALQGVAGRFGRVCGGGSSTAPTDASSQTLGPATRLPDLEHPDRSATLFSLFNADQGVPRLVLLVSPT